MASAPPYAAGTAAHSTSEGSDEPAATTAPTSSASATTIGTAPGARTAGVQGSPLARATLAPGPALPAAGAAGGAGSFASAAAAASSSSASAVPHDAAGQAAWYGNDEDAAGDGADAAQYELVATHEPGVAAVTDIARLMFYYRGVPFRDTLLETPQEVAAFQRTLRYGPRLPVLFDDAACAEINQLQALFAYLGRALDLGSAGDDSGAHANATRAAVVTEMVVGWMLSPPPNADIVKRSLAALQGALAKWSTAEGAGGITYGELAVWVYVDGVVSKHGEEFAQQAASGLARLHAALSRHAGVAQLLAARAERRAAAAAAVHAATAPAAGGAGAVHLGAALAAAPGLGSTPAAAPPAALAAPPARSDSTAKTVCVTGCAGFIASHVVRLLLDRGYTVHGTVRSLADRARLEHITGLPGAEARLKLFEADLLTPGSFDAAMAGCSAVLHMASPFFVKAADPATELIRPAVEGTQNVLRSAMRCATVKCCVVTSSAASVYVSRRPADHFYTEDDWSDLEYIRESKQHYVESKLLGEREAWRVVRDEAPSSRPAGPLRLVTICPTSTIGPLMQPYVNTSSGNLLELMNGSKATIPNKCKCFVDVR